MESGEMTSTIIGCAMKVHSVLGPGFLESVYQNALSHELRQIGLNHKCEHPIAVRYDGIVVGNFVADLFVDDSVIVENKAVQNLTTAHEVQLVNYLTATGIEIGLLVNFGAASLEFKRKHRIYKKEIDTNNFDQNVTSFISWVKHD